MGLQLYNMEILNDLVLILLLQEPKRKTNETGSGGLKRKEIDSDADSPPRKPSVHRRTVVFDSDED